MIAVAVVTIRSPMAACRSGDNDLCVCEFFIALILITTADLPHDGGGADVDRPKKSSTSVCRRRLPGTRSGRYGISARRRTPVGRPRRIIIIITTGQYAFMVAGLAKNPLR